MALPVAVIASVVTSLIKGPVASILDSYLKDAELKRKLAQDLELGLLTHLGQSLAAGQAVALEETRSEHWLTRSWRPVWMLALLALLLLVGAVLPLAEIVSGHSLPFNPRWNALPPPFWDVLTLGMGGYIGGRSLEKIVTHLTVARSRK